MKPIPIIYENDEILIINKPAGVAVQGGAGISHPLDKELPLQTGHPVHLVHRLDRGTAGLMILAKSPRAAAEWTKLIGGSAVRKEYTAVCIGAMECRRGTLRAAVVQHGAERAAVTHYEAVREASVRTGAPEPDGEIILTELRLHLETGRMHQIRIHLANIGRPILGDDSHGDFRLNKLLRKCCGAKNLMLAATRLTLPIGGTDRTFSIEPPGYMSLSRLAGAAAQADA
ncbi:MAG: RluA family pseudouridine synthase [Treponemataceae bacterium]|nr:RluA family pseudouridine synthase [Treponemataceae bacterium]